MTQRVQDLKKRKTAPMIVPFKPNFEPVRDQWDRKSIWFVTPIKGFYSRRGRGKKARTRRTYFNTCLRASEKVG